MTDTAALPEGWYTTFANTTHYIHHLTGYAPRLACSDNTAIIDNVAPPVAGDKVCQRCVSALVEAQADIRLPMGECLGCSTLQALTDAGRIADHTHQRYGNEAPCAGQRILPARHDGRDATRGDGMRKRWTLMREYEQEYAKFAQGLAERSPLGGLISDGGSLLARTEVALALCEHLIDNGDYVATVQIALRDLVLYHGDPDRGPVGVVAAAVQRVTAFGIVEWLRWAEAKMHNPCYDPWDVTAWEFVEGILQRP